VTASLPFCTVYLTLLTIQKIEPIYVYYNW